MSMTNDRQMGVKCYIGPDLRSMLCFFLSRTAMLKRDYRWRVRHVYHTLVMR